MCQQIFPFDNNNNNNKNDNSNSNTNSNSNNNNNNNTTSNNDNNSIINNKMTFEEIVYKQINNIEDDSIKIGSAIKTKTI